MDLNSIFDLINTEYMNITSLSDLGCIKLAILMKGKSVDTISAIFDVECNFTEYELNKYHLKKYIFFFFLKSFICII